LCKSEIQFIEQSLEQIYGDFWKILCISGDFWNFLYICADFWMFREISGNFCKFLEIGEISEDMWRFLDG
jgi:hypothetical protein